jgi:hypothetical protein
MHWQFMILVGFAVSAVISLAAFLVYSNLRGLYSVTQRVFRLRSDRTRAGSMDTSCRG